MVTNSISLRSELRDTLKLAGPIMLSQVGNMSMGLVDTLVAGRISTTALAGLGLAANLFWTFTSICVGCLLALDTFFAQSENPTEVPAKLCSVHLILTSPLACGLDGRLGEW